jgi:cell division transport system permease protein
MTEVGNRVPRSDGRERAPAATPGRRAADKVPTAVTQIIPKTSIAGQALIAVIAIMTFLAALTTGGVVLVLGSATEWQSEVTREMTIQVMPTPGRDIDADVRTATNIARNSPAIADVRPYSKEESTRLLEPWLGTGLSLDDLPIPRMIVIRVTSGQVPNIAAMRSALSSQVPSANLDDHRGWVDRMRAMSNTAVIGGFAILMLVLAATVLSVAFATHGAMAANRPIVEVLHFIGAKNSFIASEFRRHFLVLGLKGGLIGGGLAVLVFLLAGTVGNWFLATASADQMSALFGSFSIGIMGYLAVIAQIALIALVTAETSRRVVNQTLEAVE